MCLQNAGAMAGAAAGRAGAHGRGADTISLASGHVVKVCSVRKKIDAFDALSVQGVLSAAEGAWLGVRDYNASIDIEYFGSYERYSRYKIAQARKDWCESDRLFLDEVAKDGSKYRRLLDAEETARAFSAWLCGAALAADYAYRWIDPPELRSCVEGTFESRIEADGTRRGFKALTINPLLRFEGRKIQMRVPIDDAVRRSMRCVQYTVMPRDMEEKDERVCDSKGADHAAESEVRVLDGTPIPLGTDFVVLRGAEIGWEVDRMLGAKYKIARPVG